MFVYYRILAPRFYDMMRHWPNDNDIHEQGRFNFILGTGHNGQNLD